MSTVSFRTFGCKLNQAESAQMLHAFVSRGYVPAEGDADVVVFNTCTVTGRSESKCRQAIRSVLKNNPSVTVIVVGCYAQIEAERIASIPGVDYVLGTEDKFDLFRVFRGPGKCTVPVVRVSGDLCRAESGPASYPDQTRAFLKIQDGCNRFCTYCIVPHVRGRIRSVSLEPVLAEANRLVRDGFREIVLTGVHIGDWGKDCGSDRLPDLLRRMFRDTDIRRVRLSSLNIEDVSDSLLDCMEELPGVCRHFHIPLQSGSDAVLERMHRGYTTADFARTVDRIRQRLGPVGLGTDVIVGFPGETDRFFEETADFCKSVSFSYMHVFPFSERPGTAAARMEGKIDPRIRWERARLIRKAAREDKIRFAGSWIGKNVDVLFENRSRQGWMSGFSSEYVRVETPFAQNLLNCIQKVRIEGLRGEGVTGIVQS